MKILISGCPRSGTFTVARLLRDAGWDVPHERLGENGTVSCYYVVPWSDLPPGGKNFVPHENEKRRPIDFFDKKIHLVRNPLECIASMSKIVNRDHQRWMQNYGLIPEKFSLGYRDKLERLMWAWLNHCRFMLKISKQRVRIENFKEDWPIKWQNLFSDFKNMEIPIRHRATGYRTPEALTWEDLNNENKLLTHKIQIISEKLGYTIP